MKRRSLVIAGLSLVPALSIALAQDKHPEKREEPIEVRHDLSGLADPAPEFPEDVKLDGDDKERDDERGGFSLGERTRPEDMNAQFVALVTSAIRPGTWPDDMDYPLHGDVCSRPEPPAPGRFAVDTGPFLLLKREPSVQKEVKALIDSWASYRRTTIPVEVELIHAPADAIPALLRTTPLPDGETLEKIRSAPGVERVFAAQKIVPLNTRRHIQERRERAAKPFGENQNDLDLSEPCLAELVVSPLPSGRCQLGLHLAAARWNDAERVLVGRRYVVLASVEPGKYQTVARLDDGCGCDLVTVRLGALSKPASNPAWVFYDTSPLLETQDAAAMVDSNTPDRDEPPRFAHTLLRTVNEKLPANGPQAFRVGSLFCVRREAREAFFQGLEAWERPASTVDTVLLSTDSEKAPFDSIDVAHARALIGEGQVLERFAVRSLEGARVLGRRVSTAFNAAGERQEAQGAKSAALLEVFRGECQLRLLTQACFSAGQKPVSTIPASVSGRLEPDRYLVAQSISRDGRTTALLVGQLGACEKK